MPIMRYNTSCCSVGWPAAPCGAIAAGDSTGLRNGICLHINRHCLVCWFLLGICGVLRAFVRSKFSLESCFCFTRCGWYCDSHLSSVWSYRLAEPIKNRIPPIKNRVPPMERHAPPIKRHGPPIKNRAPPIKRDAPPIKRRVPPIKKHTTPIERRDLPIHCSD